MSSLTSSLASRTSYISINGNDDNKNVKNSSCCGFLSYLFYFFCLLSGQYSNFSKECSMKEYWSQTLISSVGCIIFIGHSIVYLIYAGITVTVEVYRIANFSFVIGTNSSDNETIICALPQEHWKFTTATTF